MALYEPMDTLPPPSTESLEEDMDTDYALFFPAVVPPSMPPFHSSPLSAHMFARASAPATARGFVVSFAPAAVFDQTQFCAPVPVQDTVAPVPFTAPVPFSVMAPSPLCVPVPVHTFVPTVVAPTPSAPAPAPLCFPADPEFPLTPTVAPAPLAPAPACFPAVPLTHTVAPVPAPLPAPEPTTPEHASRKAKSVRFSDSVEVLLFAQCISHDRFPTGKPYLPLGMVMRHSSREWQPLCTEEKESCKTLLGYTPEDREVLLSSKLTAEDIPLARELMAIWRSLA